MGEKRRGSGDEGASRGADVRGRVDVQIIPQTSCCQALGIRQGRLYALPHMFHCFHGQYETSSISRGFCDPLIIGIRSPPDSFCSLLPEVTFTFQLLELRGAWKLLSAPNRDASLLWNKQHIYRTPGCDTELQISMASMSFA